MPAVDSIARPRILVIVSTMGVDGSAWCWGGEGSSPAGPMRVDDRADWAAFSTSDRHACGIRADGSVSCGGDNTSGQLGDGSALTSAPVQIQP